MRIDTCRLHITPFSADILASILPATLSSQARNISYHTIQTFPERSYGYIDLPVMEGEKLKKKLNGSILKGKKVNIEDARPSKRRRTDAAVEPERASRVESPMPQKSNKSKTEPGVIQGHELSPGRKVKRGWTEPNPEIRQTRSKSDMTTQAASKYSDTAELLFQTNIPPNKIDAGTAATKRKTRKSQGEVIHEFERSTSQPSFLRDASGTETVPAASHYLDGQGWVDTEGRVVEPEARRPTSWRPVTTSTTTMTMAHKQRESSAVEESAPDSADTPRLESESGPQDVDSTQSEGGRDAESDDTTSSSGSSTGSISESPSSGEYSRGSRSPTPTTPSSPTGSQQRVSDSIHPLEALFKKPRKPTSDSQEKDIAKPSLEVSTSFSFMDANDLEEEETLVPGTPFSSQDTRYRGLRSAAPTPDTAYPTRYNSYGSQLSERLGSDGRINEDRDKDDLAPQTPSQVKTALQSGDRQESEFEKQFWEKRGENNRAWKQKRREALKEQRRSENRARRNRNW